MKDGKEEIVTHAVSPVRIQTGPCRTRAANIADEANRNIADCSSDGFIDTAVRRILTRPIDQRIEAFAEAMQSVLDDLATQHPRSTPREPTRMAQAIGRDVLDRLREAEASRTTTTNFQPEEPTP